MKNKIQQSEKLLQSRIEQAKANYESKLIESYHSRSHCSAIHSYIRSISGLNSLPAVMTLDSNSAASDKEKAILFNQYFHSVFSTSSFPLLSTRELTRPNSFIDAVIFNELDVFKGLRALDVSKAMGCNGIGAIGPMPLQPIAFDTSRALRPLNTSSSLKITASINLFSLSLSQHYLPLEWRTHLIKHIYKSGDKSSVRNYRPISLLCIVSKVLEKVVYDNIVEHVTQSTSERIL